MRAADLSSAERERFLDEACKGDDSLRVEVLCLLDCDTPEVPLVTQSLLQPPGDRKAGGEVAGQPMGAADLATRADDQYNRRSP